MKDSALTTLEEHLRAAADGTPGGAELFFQALLRETLFIPERFQEAPLSDAPNYPNPFFNLLGVQDGERAVIPVFCRPEQISKWCGNELKYRALSSSEFFKLIPENWWVILNPGTEIQKELSPWELDLLRGGAQNIPALAAELLADTEAPPLKIRALKPDEYPDFRQKAASLAPRWPEIQRLFILVEDYGADAPNSLPVVLIGAVLNPAADKTELGQRLQHTLEPCLIGAARLRVLIDHQVTDSLILGVFKESTPCYIKTQSGLLSRLGRWWRRLRGR